MKILIPIKRVEDPECNIRITPEGTGILQEGLKFKVNPFDEIAVEEGLRLVAKHTGEVVVVSIGGKETHEQLRHALAMGASRAIWIHHTEPVDQMSIAQLLAKVVEEEKPALVLMGKQAIDDDQNQVGQYLAEYAQMPQATFASKQEALDSEAEKSKQPGIVLSADGAFVSITREVDGGLLQVECTLPAVVTVDLRLNQPRYASLPGIMKAKTKPIKELSCAALGIAPSNHLRIQKLVKPAPRKAGVIVPDVASLVDKLRNEAKVL
ncbi:MAG: electron transfer flavoprotein subunit beta/FixA family protein [Proteobacteria bacterium]|nr:electron transfer flavoprotein subunit beta/FixA family protein [Cystobacterineae bacterium]MCL2259369.1 electron transfer flavoprotein subunit beta/FixA family protein [Cystobacterineae bacterium]MCL2314409.1 electron transfer flavoprotein subunit beta/FixA family protein [Pseudomonadota bacterium]